jgi:serine/threonine protein kinase
LACKQMSLKIMKHKHALDDLKSEIRHLKHCDHPNIIKLLDEKRTHENQYLFFEYCNGGTLSDLK